MSLNRSLLKMSIVLAVILLVGCGTQSPADLATSLPSIPTDTPTPIPSTTFTPTVTLPPTPTFPAASAPLVLQPPAPTLQAPISLANAAQVVELVRWDSIQGCDYQFCALAVSADGTRLAISYSAEGQPKGVFLYDLAGSRGLWFLPGESTQMLIFSPDGSKLVDGSGQVWDTRTGAALTKFSGIGDGNVVYSASFCDDGSRLAVSTKDALQVWNMTDGTVTKIVGHQNASIYSLAFSPDGSLIAAAYNQAKLVIMDAMKEGPPLSTLNIGRNWVASVAFAPDGQTLAAGTTEGKALILKTSDLSIVRSLNVTDTFWVTGVAFSPDGTILVAGEMSMMKLFNVADGSPLKTVEIRGGFTDFFTFTTDGRSLFLLNPDIDTSSIEWFGIK